MENPRPEPGHQHLEEDAGDGVRCPVGGPSTGLQPVQHTAGTSRRSGSLVLPPSRLPPVGSLAFICQIFECHVLLVFSKHPGVDCLLSHAHSTRLLFCLLVLQSRDRGTYTPVQKVGGTSVPFGGGDCSVASVFD